MIVTVIRLGIELHSVSIRYLIGCIAVIAACLAIHQIPRPFPEVVNHIPQADYEAPILHSLAFTIRPFALLVGVGTFMHMISSLLGLRTIASWAFSIIAPAVTMYLIHLWRLDSNQRNNVHAPVSLTPLDILILNLFLFAFGFAIVSVAVHLLRRLNPNFKANNRG